MKISHCVAHIVLSENRQISLDRPEMYGELFLDFTRCYLYKNDSHSHFQLHAGKFDKSKVFCSIYLRNEKYKRSKLL
jgi:hypothetical protein